MNIFATTKKHEEFDWANLGDIKTGRGDLTESMPVIIHRLSQSAMLDVMSKEFGLEKANDFFRKAGVLAGVEFANNLLDLSLDFNGFMAHLQKTIQDLKIGILRIEDLNQETGSIVFTVGQDLHCSGMPITNENVCVYDEGFIAGVLEAYTGKKYDVREVDCWATGERVCRFSGEIVEA